MSIVNEETVVALCDSMKVCCRKSCNIIDTDQLVPCAALLDGDTACGKHICLDCYKSSIMKQFNLENIYGADDGREIFACTKTCYMKIVRTEKKKVAIPKKITQVKIAWENDGADGVHDENTSMSVLLNWMLEDGGKNFNKYRGKNNGGEKKKHVCQTLADSMNAAGVKIERSAKQVQSKIEYIEKQFRSASDWANGTGAGVDNQESFQKAVELKCPLYYTLLPIFGDRASATAKYTSDMLNDDISANEASLAGIQNENDEELEPLIPTELYIPEELTECTNPANSTKIKSTGSRPITVASAKKAVTPRNRYTVDMTDSIEAIRKRNAEKEIRDENETKRHNVEMEKQNNMVNEAIVKEKSFDFRVKCLNQYEVMKQKGYNDREIFAILPEMIGIVNTQENEVNESLAGSENNRSSDKSPSIVDTI